MCPYATHLPYSFYLQIPKALGIAVPFYRSIGDTEFIQSCKIPKYWGMSRLRAPVTTINNKMHAIQNSGNQSFSRHLITSSDQKSDSTTFLADSDWLANCTQCGAAGPYRKRLPENDNGGGGGGGGGIGDDDGGSQKKKGRGRMFELHLIPRMDIAGCSDFCGHFSVNPRKNPAAVVAPRQVTEHVVL